MTKHPTHIEFFDALKASPIGTGLRAEIAQRRLAERQKMHEEIAAADSAHLEELPDLDAGIASALSGLRDAELRLQEARDMLSVANGAKASSCAERERLVRIYETQLRATAAPAIAEFQTHLRDELERTQKSFECLRASSENILTGEKTIAAVTNSASIMARRDALLDAIRRCEDLELCADDVEVESEIARLKASIPPIERASIR